MSTSQNSSNNAAQVTTAISDKDLLRAFNRPKEQEPEELAIQEKAKLYDEMLDEFKDWNLAIPSTLTVIPLLYLQDMYEHIETHCNVSIMINKLTQFIADNMDNRKELKGFTIPDACILIDAMVFLQSAAAHLN